jgi:dihydrofolate reductase
MALCPRFDGGQGEIMRNPGRIEGHAIVSADGMIANAEGQIPPSLVFEADQRLFMQALNAADLVVHGRHSAEKPASSTRRRVMVTSRAVGIAADPSNTNVLFWNPAGASFEQAVAALGSPHGAIAILGGTSVFGLFLDRYDAFHLSRAANVRIPGGRPVFPGVPASSPEDVLRSHGLAPDASKVLDREHGLTLTVWRRTQV